MCVYIYIYRERERYREILVIGVSALRRSLSVESVPWIQQAPQYWGMCWFLAGRHTCVYIYIYIHMCICVYIYIHIHTYIHIQRERERERETSIDRQTDGIIIIVMLVYCLVCSLFGLIHVLR